MLYVNQFCNIYTWFNSFFGCFFLEISYFKSNCNIVLAEAVLQMTGETEIKKAFNDLRPLCVGLTKNADKASILSLHSQLKSTPCMVIQALHEYFLFPLRIVLLKHKETKEDVIIAAINCMTYIFENIKLTEFKVFYDTLKLLIVCITLSIWARWGPSSCVLV